MSQETILIIDDESFIRETVQRILGEDGYTVLSAASGQEAQTLIAGQDVDLALLDLNLGPENGLQARANTLPDRCLRRNCRQCYAAEYSG